MHASIVSALNLTGGSLGIWGIGYGAVGERVRELWGVCIRVSVCDHVTITLIHCTLATSNVRYLVAATTFIPALTHNPSLPPLQGYALHGHVDLHPWHTYMGSTGTSAQYILPVPWSRDCYLLGTRSLVKLRAKHYKWFREYIEIILMF